MHLRTAVILVSLWQAPLSLHVFPVFLGVPLYLVSLGARPAQCWKWATVIDWVFVVPNVGGRHKWQAAIQLQLKGKLGPGSCSGLSFGAVGTHECLDVVFSSRGSALSGGIYFTSEAYLGLTTDCFAMDDGMQKVDSCCFVWFCCLPYWTFHTGGVNVSVTAYYTLYICVCVSVGEYIK